VRHSTVHHIRTVPGPPVTCRPRRLAPDRLAIAKAKFDAMLWEGTARRSESSWSSALHIVPKKDNGWRPCEKCTHVFLRQDATRRALEPPYSGPYKVLSRIVKTLQLLVRGRPVTVSADRVKPPYTLSETDYRNGLSPPVIAAPAATQHAIPPRPLPANPTPAIPPPTTPQQPPTETTRSDRHIHFPTRFKT
jgi:hypothetical protein